MLSTYKNRKRMIYKCVEKIVTIFNRNRLNVRHTKSNQNFGWLWKNAIGFIVDKLAYFVNYDNDAVFFFRFSTSFYVSTRLFPALSSLDRVKKERVWLIEPCHLNYLFVYTFDFVFHFNAIYSLFVIFRLLKWDGPREGEQADWFYSYSII